MALKRLSFSFFLIAAIFCVFIYESPITYVMLYTFVLLPILTLATALISRKCIKVTQAYSSPVIVKNEITTLTVILSNPSILFLPRIRLCFISDYQEAVNISGLDTAVLHDVELGPRKTRSYRFSVSCRYRGKYVLGLEKIEIYDALSLFKLTKWIGYAPELLVYPTVHEIQSLPIQSLHVAETSSSLKKQNEDTATPSDIRKYEPTDSVKKIHWKLSAKKNELLIKNFQSTAMSTTYIFVDTRHTSGDLLIKLRLEDAVTEEITSVINHCRKRGYPSMLCYLSNDGIQKASCDTDFVSIYHEAASIDFNTVGDFVRLIEDEMRLLKDSTNIIVFSQNLDERLHGTLHGLKVVGHNIIFFNYLIQ